MIIRDPLYEATSNPMTKEDLKLKNESNPPECSNDTTARQFRDWASGK